MSYIRDMAKTQRITDPTQVGVQLNVQVPWQFREDLIAIAHERDLSLAELVRETLMENLMLDNVREATRAAGATR
jgi:hypothetical protein